MEHQSGRDMWRESAISWERRALELEQEVMQLRIDKGNLRRQRDNFWEGVKSFMKQSDRMLDLIRDKPDDLMISVASIKSSLLGEQTDPGDGVPKTEVAGDVLVND